MKQILFITLCCWMYISTQAQEIRKIPIQEALDMAVQNSKQLQLDSLKKQSLQIKKEQTKAAIMPMIGVTSAYTRLSDNIDPFTISVPGVGSFDIQTNIPNQFANVASIKQPIFQGLKNWNTMKALDQQAIATDFDALKDKNDIKLLVVQYYYNLFALQQRVVLLDSTIIQTQSRVNDLTKLKDAGIILNNEVMRAELQKNNFEVEKVNLVSNIETINFYLNILLGLDPETKINTESPESTNNTLDKFLQLQSIAYGNRPEFKAQDYRTKSADYMIKASKAAYMPTISASANGQYNNPNQRMFPPKSVFKATWDVGISLSWNIMQLYTARSVVNDAKNQKSQITILTEQLKDNISIEVNTNMQAIKVAQAKIELAQKAIDQATENKRILDNRFNAQVALLTDVLDADVFLLQAKTNLLNAQAEAIIANYKLQKSLGQL